MTHSDDQTGELDPLQREALQWIVRLTSGAATAADAEALRRWRAQSEAHEAAFLEAARLRRTLRRAAAEIAAEYPSSTGGARCPAGRPVSAGRRALLGGAIAASAAAAAYLALRPPMGLWPSLAELTAEYRTATGEQRQVTLADGVSLAMNTQTSIAVPSPREIELIAGEAEIRIGQPPSQPLEVVAAGGRTIAGEATFNVRRYGSLVAVTCLEGGVEVRQHHRSANLRASQQVSYGNGNLGDIVSVDPALVTAWRQGLLIFHNERLSLVIDEVNRYRPGRIILANGQLGNRLVNGVFHVDRIDGVIDQIRKLGATVVSLPGGVVLVS
jgi:transmembrane sensor